MENENQVNKAMEKLVVDRQMGWKWVERKQEKESRQHLLHLMSGHFE